MVDLGTYEFKDLNTEKLNLKNVLRMLMSKKLLRVILYAKHEKLYLHKVIKTECKNSTMKKRNDLLKLLYKYE